MEGVKKMMLSEGLCAGRDCPTAGRHCQLWTILPPHPWVFCVLPCVSGTPSRLPCALKLLGFGVLSRLGFCLQCLAKVFCRRQC